MKGQAQQAFSIIFIIIVLVFIIIFGTKFIGLLMNKGCDAHKSSFIREVDNIISAYSTYGAKQRVILSSPCKAEYLCLLKKRVTENEISNHNGNVPPIVRSQLAEAAKSGSANIFLVEDNTLIDVSNNPKVDLWQPRTGEIPFLCIPNKRGVFEFVVLGRTSKVLFRGDNGG